MVPATDFALKARARWVGLCIGLAACSSQGGCAKMRSFGQGTPPMLGAAAPFGKTKHVTPGGDLYAQEVGRGVSNSRAMLAQARAERQRGLDSSRGSNTALARSSAEPPASSGAAAEEAPTLEVALQAPLTAPSAAGTTPAATPSPEGNPAPPPAAPDAPKGEAEPKDLQSILESTRSRLDALVSYQVTIKRQERVNETLQPAEEVLLSIRREPRAVRLEWPSGPNKGREVLYSAGTGDGLMHVKMAETIVPVPPMALAPDSPMVLRSSRHPITEAGFEAIVEGLEKTLAAASTPDSPHGKLSYGGLENPGQLERPSHKIVRVTPTGESWVVYIDPSTKLPVLVQGNAANGDLLERYLFGEPKADPIELTSAEAFDPAQRWGKSSSGLLSRLARAGGSKPAPETTAR